MCLWYSKRMTERLKNSGQKSIVAWKVLRRTSLEVFGEPDKAILLSLYMAEEYLPGWKHSNRPRTGDPLDSGRAIHRGIHVFLSEAAARIEANGHPVVPVRCYLRDMVAAGTWDDSGGPHCAVFYKVFVARKDYDQALKLPAD